MRAITASRTMWWCRGRFWFSRISCHPVTAQALRGATAAPTFGSNVAAPIQNAARTLLRRLAVNLVRWTDAGWEVRPRADAPMQVREEFAAVMRNAEPSHRRWNTLLASSSSGLHFLRVASRAFVLSQTSMSRQDAEGILDVDLLAQSSKAWFAWRNGLTSLEQSALEAFRCGTLGTATRRAGGGPDRVAAPDPCPHCLAPFPSVRHFVVHCPAFAACRVQACRDAGLPLDRLGSLPRVCTKSGWIVRSAHRLAAKRVSWQIALCRIGVEVARRLRGSQADNPLDPGGAGSSGGRPTAEPEQTRGNAVEAGSAHRFAGEGAPATTKHTNRSPMEDEVAEEQKT